MRALSLDATAQGGAGAHAAPVHAAGGGAGLHRRLGRWRLARLEPFFTAVGALLLAQVVVDALWVTR
jgi:hypothetical protein